MSAVRYPKPPRRRRRLFRLLLVLLLTAWLLPAAWVFWPPLELNPWVARYGVPTRDAFYRLEDPLRRLLGGFSVPDTLPVLRFALPEGGRARLLTQLDSIRARGVNAGDRRVWEAAELRPTPDAPPLAAQLTWHGKYHNHWNGRQRSVKVKLAKGSRWWGLKSFALLTPDRRDLGGLAVVNDLATQAGIWHPRARLVRVEVDGADWGLYYAEELIDRDFLDRRGLPNGVLLAPRAVWADDFPDHRRTTAYGRAVGFGDGPHTHELALEPAFQEVDAPADSLARRALAAWATVRDLARQATLAGTAPDPATAPLPDSAAVARVLDVAAWGAADALRHLLADEHNLTGDNLNVVWDPATGRCRPIYRFEGGLAPLVRAGGLTNAATLHYNGRPLPLWLLVNRQPTLRRARLRALHRLTATPGPTETALRRAAPTAALTERAAGSQRPIRQRRWQGAALSAALRHNRALIHQSLTADAWLYASARYQRGRLWLELLPEAEGALALLAVETHSANGVAQVRLPRPYPLLTRTGPRLPGGPEALLRTLDTLSLPWPDRAPGSVRLTVQNALTGQALPDDRVRVVVTD